MLAEEEIMPGSAQPSPKSIENWFSFLSSHYDSILVLTISSALSGFYNLVKGGRVSPMKGLLAKLLNIKPIITINKLGQAVPCRQSFSRRQNFKKILKMIRKRQAVHPVHSFSIVHAGNRPRAEAYAREIERITGRQVSFIEEASPVVGVHNGLGAVGVCLSYE